MKRNSAGQQPATVDNINRYVKQWNDLVDRESSKTDKRATAATLDGRPLEMCRGSLPGVGSRGNRGRED